MLLDPVVPAQNAHDITSMKLDISILVAMYQVGVAEPRKVWGLQAAEAEAKAAQIARRVDVHSYPPGCVYAYVSRDASVSQRPVSLSSLFVGCSEL